MRRTYVILGGGTAGWMTAAAFARFVNSENAKIILIESDSIGTVGVGEATIPHIRVFNDMLGIDEAVFMREVNATYKLGIRFSGWGDSKSDYYHPFGDHGFTINHIPFHHYWLGAKALGLDVGSFDMYSMANVLASREKFTYPSSNPRDVLSTFSYAYHLDAAAYAKLLRSYAEARGVVRIEGEMRSVNRNNMTGYIESLILNSGQQINADFFIDCSGFRSRLLGQELAVEFESWKKWLPCDSALAVPTENTSPTKPYTRSTAKTAGWCWQIPLVHRTGNGHVFCSEFTTKDNAYEELKSQLPGKMLKEPMLIKFEAGIRKKTWEKNCVAIGLACGFLEPLESTSIYLIEVAILKLLELLPVDTTDCSIEEGEFNRQMSDEYVKVRDFIILHYALNNRPEAFWKFCAEMQLPSSLQEKINTFKSTAQVTEYDSGLFRPPSWLAVYFGQGLLPTNLDSRLSTVNIQASVDDVKNYASQLLEAADKIEVHPDKPQRSPGSKMSLYGIRR